MKAIIYIGLKPGVLDRKAVQSPARSMIWALKKSLKLAKVKSSSLI